MQPQDELKIMKLLEYTIEDYSCVQINPEKKPKIKHQHKPRTIPKPCEIATLEPVETEEELEKRVIANCKFAVGDRIRHNHYGVGVVRKVEVMNEEILLLTVLYESIGISLHLLSDDEWEITLINDRP